MAYSKLTPPDMITERKGSAGGAIWVYRSTDDLSTVSGINYIYNAAELGMTAGDEVLHVDTTNGVTNRLTVQAGATTGTASGATTNTAGYAVGVTTVTLASAGTGTIIIGDIIRFGNDMENEYRVTTGDADVSNGGSVVFTPALVTAIPASATPIYVQSNVLNLSPQSTGGGEVLTAAKTLVAGDSGKTLYLGSTTGFAVTLPSPAMGLKFRFVAQVVPTTGNCTIVTASSANIMFGVISSSDLNNASDVSLAASADTISFVASTCVKGDYVTLESDGTNWFYEGMTGAQAGMTSTQAS